MPIAIALMGSVLKDCLMLGALLVATGLLAIARPGRDGAWRGLGILLCVAAATLRFNAFFATVAADRRAAAVAAGGIGRGASALATILAIAVSLVAMPLANKAIGAEKSDVELSLVIFDLGGITKHSGIDMFPPIGVTESGRGQRAAATAPTSGTATAPGRPGNARSSSRRSMPGSATMAAMPGTLCCCAPILAHPIAYRHHRLAHFNLNSRFLVRDVIDKPVPNTPAPTPGNFQITPNPRALRVRPVAVVECAHAARLADLVDDGGARLRGALPVSAATRA